MAYGIKVFNEDNRVILDSSENRPMLIKKRGGSYTPNQSENSGPTTGKKYSTLASSPTLLSYNPIFVHRTASGYIGHEFTSGGTGNVEANKNIWATTGGTVNWMEIAPTSAAGITAFNSGYGLNVFDGLGTSTTNLLFTSAAANSLEITNVGYFNPSASALYTDIGINSTVPHYVLLNTSSRILFAGGGGPAGFVQQHQLECYEYIYSGSTLQTIRLHSQRINLINSSSVRLANVNRAYIIAKLRT